MSIRRFTLLAAALLTGSLAQAFPPAPFHSFFGTVRDEFGRPLNSDEGTITLSGESGDIVSTLTDATIALGVNYRLQVPMDAGTIAQLYQVTAMRPLLPFTIKVTIGNTAYVPLQIVGKNWNMGQAGGKTRLDLTLGVDRNKDGLPDAWQQAVVDADTTGKLKSIDDVKPNLDLSGNGMTNLQKFLAGVNALDQLDGVKLEVVDVANGVVHLQFLGIAGRSYTIKSSTDSVNWVDQNFSVETTGDNAFSVLRPDTIQTVDAYVKWASPTHGYFQLFAQ